MSSDHSHDHGHEYTAINSNTNGRRHGMHDDGSDEETCGCLHDHAEVDHQAAPNSDHSHSSHDHDHYHNHRVHESNHSSTGGCCGDAKSSSGGGCETGCCEHTSDSEEECACCDHDALLSGSSTSGILDHSHASHHHEHKHERKQGAKSQIVTVGSIELVETITSALHRTMCDFCDVESGQMKHDNPISTRLRIANLCCAGEAVIIHRCLDDLKGISNVAVNVLGRYIIVKHCAAQCCAPIENILDILNKERLGASIQETSSDEVEEEDSFSQYLHDNIWRWVHVSMLILLLIAGGICQDVVTNKNNARFISSTTLYMIGTAFGIVPIISGAWVSIQRRVVDIKTLMMLAIIGALATKEFFDACLVVTLFIIAELVEEIALQKVRSAVRTGVGLGRPSKFVILPDGSKRPIDKVQVNDIICCRAGDSIPVDGNVSKGECVVSESALTGESMPISKSVGSVVKSGTIIQNGYIEIVVTVPVTEGTYQRLQRTVDMLQTDRGQYAQIVDRFAVYWTPLIILTSILLVLVGGGVTKQWNLYIHKALTVLVLACPCAILLASPLPSVCAIATAIKFGVLIKGSSAIERASTIDSVSVDKTGTLTKGLFKVTNKLSLNDDVDYSPIQLAAAIESKSSHPLANAIVSDCVGCVAETDIVLPNVKKIKVIEGIGMSGWVEVSKDNWQFVRIGNERLLEQFGGDLSIDKKSMEKVNNFTGAVGKGAVIVFVAVEDSVDLVLALADEVREEAKVFVSQVSDSLNMEINMLTGDHEDVALSIGRAVGIPDECIRSRLLPNEKLQFIENLQKKTVAMQGKNVLMVGDGINDAAALTKATIGVAMGEGGSAMAIECADVVIMSDNLLRIPATIFLSKICQNIVIQNVVISILIKIVALVLAVSGYLPFWAAVITDIGALLVILLNSTRLLVTDVFNQSNLDKVFNLKLESP